MLRFNSKGLLIPNSNIKSTIEEFENEFVTTLNSKCRADLYQRYRIYSDTLKSALNNIELLQWIDGSFVTKKPEPNDIDLVTFISGDDIDASGVKIDQFKYPSSIELFGVDAYVVKVYKKGHRSYPLYAGDQLYWMDAFDKLRRDRNGHKLPKGFLEIIY